MQVWFRHLLSVLVPGCLCFSTWICVLARIPETEVDALQQIVSTMGSVYWKFDPETCQVEELGLTQKPPPNSAANITCSCDFKNNTCHVVAMELKGFSLPGVLPPELVKLPYLQQIDFPYNYLTGVIPVEWASMRLNFISLLGNRLSGKIPKDLGNITSLKYLDLEVNQFSGEIPRELGKLVNLETLMLSSNQLTGSLPEELGELGNLKNFRINDNNFNGTIPGLIQNWKQIKRLEMIASGFKGPIPSSISVLNKLTDLRISDLNGPSQKFPALENMTGLTRILLRSCNISGEIPLYIWGMSQLRIVDLSFNRLVGELPSVIATETLVFIFLSGNLLNGSIPESILRKGTTVDLSYNNFMWQSPEQPACQQSIGLYLNLFRSSSDESNLRGVLPCISDFRCSKRWHSLYVDCGGNNVEVRRNRKDITYEGDNGVDGGAAKLFLSDVMNLGFSSTGDFMDDNDFQNTRYIATSPYSNISELYATARLSPLSLSYYRYCLENGSYTVTLHFAEIQFTNDSTYSSLGKRIFDIYIQDRLVEKNFDITKEAGGVIWPLMKQFNATVTNEILEIRFYWAGKGTTRVPVRGVYGPLISAISVDPNFLPVSDKVKKNIAAIVTGVVGSSLIILVVGLLCWRRHTKAGHRKEKDLDGVDSQTASFTLKQIKAATNNFDSMNKIGEGGFGPVYKGLLPDGTIIAVKQLSSKSSQGNREFLNEIGMISCLQHQNVVKLHGCCIEGDQLMLVYEYLENNSLSRALFGREESRLKLDWQTRHNICIGVARGLAFLHEETKLKIVHRDIKGTNILLDDGLNPKISDFGLARLYEGEKTHVSTRVAGTIGYMAPEYALWGYLSHKADVYSYGIVALEIVSGKQNSSFGLVDGDFACLHDWVCQLQKKGKVTELVDQRLGSEYNKTEVERTIKVALLCSNSSPSLRPAMSEVVRMLEGNAEIPDVVPEGRSPYSRNSRSRPAMDDSSSLATGQELYDINTESYSGFGITRVEEEDDGLLRSAKSSDGRRSRSLSLLGSTSAIDLHDTSSNKRT